MLNIGVLVGNVSSEHTIQLIQGITSRAAERGVQINAFLGLHTNDFYEIVYRKSAELENYDYQNNVVYSYVDLAQLDALLISNSTVGRFLDGRSMEEFLGELGDIPKVIIEEADKWPGCSTIICDNYQGMVDLTNHLIEVHGCKNLVTIAGPENNTDADERLRGIRDAMQAHGLLLDDSRIERSDYSAMVEAQTERLFARHPDLDAILCANDLMAETACHVCESMGKTPGVDVCITGFDDTELCTTVNPTLTSVRQNSIHVGRRALDLAISLCEGGAVEHVLDPAKVYYRMSCGCPDHLGAEHYRGKLADMSERFRNFQQLTWFMPIVSRDMLDAVDDDEQFYGVVMDKLQELSCKSAWLLMFREPVEHEYAAPWTCPEEMDVVISLRGGKKQMWVGEDRPKVTRENGLEKLGMEHPEDTPITFKSVLPLFSGKMQLGALVLEAPIENLPFIYLALQQFENAINFYNLNRALEAKNEVLRTISSRDPLTNTLNRRGLMEKVLEARRLRSNLTLGVYLVDMDHLKEINDSFGHGEGDQALITLVRVLGELSDGKERFLARVGGDEFLLVDTNAKKTDAGALQRELHAQLEEYNQASGKPYYVEASVGYASLPWHRGLGITDILECADENLYEAKAGRRETAIRV